MIYERSNNDYNQMAIVSEQDNIIGSWTHAESIRVAETIPFGDGVNNRKKKK